MAVSESTLAVRLPQELAAELEQLARETGRSKSYYARKAIIEFLEDRADYLRAVAILERERGAAQSHPRRGRTGTRAGPLSSARTPATNSVSSTDPSRGD